MASVASQALVIVRDAMAADHAALAALYARCRALAEWLPEAERTRGDFDRDTSGEEVLVALGDDGAIDGFVSVWRPQSFIHHLYVRPEARRRGVASALLDAMEGRFTHPWRLKCVRVNTVAMEFYARRGWREVGSGRGVQGHHVVLELAR